MNFVNKYVLAFLKAHVAGLGAGLVMLGADLAAGPVSTAQWEAVALTVIGVGGAVALVPNKRAVAAAVAQDIAPVLPPVVSQDAAELVPIVQEVAAAVEPALPAQVAADVQNVVSAAQAVVQAVAVPVAHPLA